MIKVKNSGRAAVIVVVSIAVFVILYLLVTKVEFSSGKTFFINFDYVGTINRGSIVRKSGLKVGSVRELHIDPKDQRTVITKVTLQPNQEVRTGDSFAIVTRGILGDQYVEVFPGPLSAPVAPDGYVFDGKPLLDFNSLIVQGGSLMKNLLESTETLNRIILENEGSVNRTLSSIENLTSSLALITGSAEEIRNFVPDIKEELVASMRTLSDSIQSLSTESSRLISSLDTQVDRTSVNLNASFESVTKAADELSSLLSELNADNSVLSRLNNAGIADDFIGILNNVETTTQNLMTASTDIRRSIEELLGSGGAQ